MSSASKIRALLMGMLVALPLGLVADVSAEQLTGPTLSDGAAAPQAQDEFQVTAQRLYLSHKLISDPQSARDTANLSPLLDQQSGMETQGLGMGKAWTTLAIRGQSFRETVILLNGVRVPESFDLGSIPTESIESIQIIEGPEALAICSDALGGLIDIHTRDAEGNRHRLQFSMASFNTFQYQLSSPSILIGGVVNTLSGSWFHSDGYLPPVTGYNGFTFPFTDQEHWDLTDSAAWKIGDASYRLQATYLKHFGSSPDADNAIAAGTGQYDLDGRQDAWGLRGQLTIEQPLAGWSLGTTLSGDYSDVMRENPIGADPTSGVYAPYHSVYLDYGAKLLAKGSAGDAFPELRVGLDLDQEGLSSGLYGDQHRRYTGSLLLGATWKMAPRLHLALNNRLDAHTGIGALDNPSATLSYELSKDLRFHISAGHGSKIPSFDQLYLPYSSFAALPPALAAQYAASPFFGVYAGQKGNPLLSPEQSTNTELGSDLWFGAFQLQVSGFANFYRDLISARLDARDNFWSYSNIPQASFIGTEDCLKIDLFGIAMPYVSATYISARDERWLSIPGRLRFKGTAGFELRPEKTWTLDLNARYVDRYPIAEQILTDLGKPQPPTDYWNLNAAMHYSISEHLSGYFMLDNILDVQTASFQGIPLPGRNFQSGFQASF